MTKSWQHMAALQNLITNDKLVSFPCLALSSDVLLLRELTDSWLLFPCHPARSWIWISDPAFLCNTFDQRFDKIILKNQFKCQCRAEKSCATVLIWGVLFFKLPLLLFHRVNGNNRGNLGRSRNNEFSGKAIDILLSSPLISEVLWFGNRKALM